MQHLQEETGAAVWFRGRYRTRQSQAKENYGEILQHQSRRCEHSVCSQAVTSKLFFSKSKCNNIWDIQLIKSWLSWPTISVLQSSCQLHTRLQCTPRRLRPADAIAAVWWRLMCLPSTSTTSNNKWNASQHKTDSWFTSWVGTWQTVHNKTSIVKSSVQVQSCTLWL